jgi:hypothetical protein
MEPYTTLAAAPRRHDVAIRTQHRFRIRSALSVFRQLTGIGLAAG